MISLCWINNRDSHDVFKKTFSDWVRILSKALPFLYFTVTIKAGERIAAIVTTQWLLYNFLIPFNEVTEQSWL